MELRASLRLQWQPIGQASIGPDSMLCFPKLTTRPGLYRFKIRKSGGSEAAYVGETDNLQRRFAHYRNPGPTQATNLRLNALFRDVLLSTGTIEVDVVVDKAWLTWGESEVMADLTRKSVRRLFENFVLSAERATEIEDLNR